MTAPARSPIDEFTELSARRQRWLVNRLLDVLKPSEISLDDDDLENNAVDRSGHRLPGRPLVVARPQTIEAVQAVLRVAGAAGATVVPRGAGTGLSGAAAAPDSAIVLSTERLNSIVRIDPDNEIAFVQPGVITAELDAAAAEHGLMYAPDPASSSRSPPSAATSPPTPAACTASSTG